MSEPIHHSDLSAALAQLGFTEPPAQFHGALCGALCSRAAEQVDIADLLDALGGANSTSEDAERLLLRLRADSEAAMGSAEMSFAPLLPEDDKDLAARAAELSSWCEGFLFGLSTGRPLNMKKCSPEMKELLRDFTQFTQAGLSSEGDPEKEETAYAELVEYIRVGVQLIFMELHGHSTADVPAAENPTVH